MCMSIHDTGQGVALIFSDLDSLLRIVLQSQLCRCPVHPGLQHRQSVVSYCGSVPQSNHNAGRNQPEGGSRQGSLPAAHGAYPSSSAPVCRTNPHNIANNAIMLMMPKVSANPAGTRPKIEAEKVQIGMTP